MPSPVRRLPILLVAALAAGLLGPVQAAAGTDPKVAIIVGPVGPEATPRYRAQADEAARIARRYTRSVVTVYSPDATWPAVRRALDGASLVVYMGHGNGWPSRYRDALYPPTQNGLGLNPVAGEGDARHQYFGEAAIGSRVRLARDAVVLLHHLCYASGNTEPGLPEGTVAQARQRIDNYAAGFIRAGAGAVIAEAWTSPAWMVRSILGGRRSIERIWRSSPIANGNVSAFESRRSPGYVGLMDPDRPTGGFHRSIVLRAGLASSDVLAGGRGRATDAPRGGGGPGDPAPPSLVDTGVAIRTPALPPLTTAGTSSSLRLPFEIPDRSALPRAMAASVRWDPLELAPAPTSDDETTEPPGASSGPGASPGPRLPLPPPERVGLVQPERLGDVVEPVAVRLDRTRIVVPVALPERPGLYRLTVTLHDGDGVAYDAPTQDLVPSLLVRVLGPLDARVLAAPEATLTAGTNVPLDVRVANLGTASWGHPTLEHPSERGDVAPATRASVVGHWIALGEVDPAGLPAPVRTEIPSGLRAGVTVTATLDLAVPVTTGDYLLVLDLVTPEHGSLGARGVPPAIVRIRVLAPPG